MTMVLSPEPVMNDSDRPMCAPAGAIRGKTIGIRTDYWTAWTQVADEWATLLEADGAIIRRYKSPIGKGETAAAAGGEGYAQFLSDSDIVISGLCNCGSCTLWAIHDAVGALDTGHPTLAVCTEHFEPLARMLAGQRGHTNLRLKVLPFPLEGRPEDEVRQIARDNYESMLEVLGAVR